MFDTIASQLLLNLCVFIGISVYPKKVSVDDLKTLANATKKFTRSLFPINRKGQFVENIKDNKKIILVLLIAVFILQLTFSLHNIKNACRSQIWWKRFFKSLWQSFLTVLIAALGVVLVFIPFIGEKIIQEPFKKIFQSKGLIIAICFVAGLAAQCSAVYFWTQNKLIVCVKKPVLPNATDTAKEWSSKRALYLDVIRDKLDLLPPDPIDPSETAADIKLLKTTVIGCSKS